jgi:uncharacterized membrane protein YfcA
VSLTTICVVLLASFLGSLVQAVTGFGYVVLALPLVALVLPFQTAAVAFGILGFVISLGLGWQLRAHIDWHVLVAPLIASLFGRMIGVHALVHLNGTLLVGVLGVLLVALGFWAVFYRSRTVIAANRRNGVITGFSGGILGGLCGMPGPPLALYLSSALHDKNRYAATLQALFGIGASYNIVLYFLYGSVTREVLQIAGLGVIALLAGASTGMVIFRRLDLKRLNRAIDVFVIAMGAILLANAARAVW